MARIRSPLEDREGASSECPATMLRRYRSNVDGLSKRSRPTTRSPMVQITPI